MSRVGFVAMLYTGFLCCLGLASIQIYQQLDYWLFGASAMMESSDPIIARSLKAGLHGGVVADVTYNAAGSHVPVHGKFVPEQFLLRLSEGKPIPVRFIKSDPQQALFDSEEIPAPWIPGILGMLLLSTAIFAHRLLRKEESDRGLA